MFLEPSRPNLYLPFPFRAPIDLSQCPPLYLIFALGRQFPFAPRVIPRAARFVLPPGISEILCQFHRESTALFWPHERMSTVKATQLRPGMVIQHEGQLYTVFSTDHRTPGNKRGSMQTRLKNLRTGIMIDYRFRAEEFVDRAILDEIEFEYLYQEGDDFHFMNTQTYEQMQMTKDELGRNRALSNPQYHRQNRILRGKGHRRGPARHHGHEGHPDRAHAPESHRQRRDEARNHGDRAWS